MQASFWAAAGPWVSSLWETAGGEVCLDQHGAHVIPVTPRENVLLIELGVRAFPGGSVVKTTRFHCSGSRFHLRSGTKIPLVPEATWDNPNEEENKGITVWGWNWTQIWGSVLGLVPLLG